LEEGRPLEKDLESCFAVFATGVKQPRGSEKGREVACPVCLCVLSFVFVGVRIWFSNGDAWYVETEEWFHEPGTILKEKTVQEEQREFGAGKERSGGRGRYCS